MRGVVISTGSGQYITERDVEEQALVGPVAASTGAGVAGAASAACIAARVRISRRRRLAASPSTSLAAKRPPGPR